MSQLELLLGASLFKTFKPFERFKGIRCPVIPAQAGKGIQALSCQNRKRNLDTGWSLA
jgi:hypothetical protein